MSFQNNCVSVYEELSKVPSIDSLTVIQDSKTPLSKKVLHWEAKWSRRDLVRSTKINYTTNGLVTSCSEGLECVKTPFINEICNEKLVSVAFNDTNKNVFPLKAVLLEIEINGEKHYFLDIWKGSKKVSSVDLTKQNKHGMVHANTEFGCLNWSNDNQKILYIAEKKIPKGISYFDVDEGDGVKGQKYLYREDWGEQLVGTYHPSLFMYDVSTKEVTDLSSYFPDDVSIARGIWSKDDKLIYGLAWDSSPWKLGLIYCPNRFSSLFEFNLETKKYTSLTDGKSCVSLPILNPNKTKLLYIETIPMGPHQQCSKLQCIALDQETKQYSPNLIVDIVDNPADVQSFQGLFVDDLSEKCWLSNGHQLIVCSVHRSNRALLCIDVDSGKVNLLETEGMWKVLNVTNDVIFVSYSSPNTPTILKAGIFDPIKIDWIDLETSVSKLNDVSWVVQNHEPRKENTKYPGINFESILIKPAGNKPYSGLIVNPHGGPHSCFIAGFDLFSACFCKLGYAVLRVNYRGSLGFGQNSVMSLPGNISRQDVSDVQQAAEATQKDLDVPSGKVFVTGGSHGGFLTLQLVGQHPDFYAAAATRNPVSNVASERSSTDIMDWCQLEGGASPFTFGNIPTPEDLAKLIECSPISNVANVKAPILFMVGLCDLRVPPSQSFEYIRAMRGLGKKVSVLAYEKDNHPISKVDSEADCFVNTAMWFNDNKFQ